MGKIALGGGSLQVVATMTAFALGFLLFKPFSQALTPGALLLVRSRFQLASQDLKAAGATTVVDEENTVGRVLAHEALSSLELGQDAGLACALAGRSPAVTATPKSETP